jgi:hypothetical protein
MEGVVVEGFNSDGVLSKARLLPSKKTIVEKNTVKSSNVGNMPGPCLSNVIYSVELN